MGIGILLNSWNNSLFSVFSQHIQDCLHSQPLHGKPSENGCWKADARKDLQIFSVFISHKATRNHHVYMPPFMYTVFI